MCETKVFLRKNGEEELFMEDVISVVPEQDNLKISNLFGDNQTIKGKIGEIQFLEHKIVIEQND